jgi:hypothetical protein
LDQVVFPATHNAMSNEDEDWSIPNQPHSIERQLEDGVRGMLLDTWEEEGELYLCHGYCEIGSRPLVDALVGIRTFLEANPGEVLVFIFEDHISVEQTVAAFAESGLDRYTWTWAGGAWPTLGELVAADTRLLVTTENSGPPPDWVHHAWDLFVDTPYSFEALDELNCDVNRGDPSRPLFLLNHWLADPVSTRELGAQANTWDVLYGRATDCAADFGRPPNLVAVDWYTEGDLFAVVDALNGL